MKLAKGESIVTAYAERAYGPGWANSLVWVIVRSRDGALRQECLQPEDQSPAISWLYLPSEAMHLAMSAAVGRQCQ